MFLDKIKNGVRFELPKYKSALQYQEKNDVCYVFTNNQGKKTIYCFRFKINPRIIKNNIIILSIKKEPHLAPLLLCFTFSVS